MSENITDIFDEKTITYYKTNKNLITYDLLDELRKTKTGKDIAFKILDIEKNDEGHYLDNFGNSISFKKIPTLKSINSKLPLHSLHIEEIKRCSEDIFYFMDNYVKITTKDGINYPDLRYYQREFLETILPNENESIVALLPRQSGKSISVSIYLCWCLLFYKDINIGVAAQIKSMAKEFLLKVKNIFIYLPIWLTPGVKVWNELSIAFENGMRMIADTASSNSFRGYTMSIVVTDESAYITGKENGTTRFKAYLDSILPTQSSLAFKKNIFISTANGMNDFYTLYKGALKNGFEIVEELLPAEKALYSDSVENHYKNRNNLEKEQNILNIKKIKEKYLVKYKKRKQGDNGSIAFYTDWKKVPRFKQDGSVKTPEEFRDEEIARKGEVFFNQAYKNSFIGSSYTLISAEKLKNIDVKKPLEIIGGKLKIYEYFKKGEKYICSVDPAKDGKDGFVVNFVKISNLKFKQVAVAKLDIDYLLMPQYLNDWCQMYGNPYLIIENNEGAGQSVADQMMITYEYENLHFDKNRNVKNNVKAKKKYPGTRTTPRTRKQILQTMKTFFDNGNLEIVDQDTIDQLYTFILINEKYQADEGCFDDCVMSLALSFTIFNNVKNFSDMKAVTTALRSVKESEVDVSSIISIGSFDDGTHETKNTDPFGVIYEGFDDTIYPWEKEEFL